MPEDMTVMIVDGGARGHVISELYENDPRVKRIVVAPGNDGIGYKRKKDVIIAKDSSLKDPNSLLAVARKYSADLVDVAQDDALALGTVDLLRANDFLAFGATKDASQIEWDKGWSRDFMKRHDIPSPHFEIYDIDSMPNAKGRSIEYVRSRYAEGPNTILYVKAAGLCAGKGALRCTNLQEALLNIDAMQSFGTSGRRFVIEDGMTGEEFSYVVISDGLVYRGFMPGQDNKLSENFDRGDQTGGMGANAPALVAMPMIPDIRREIITPAISGMNEEGRPFAGILYLGGMEVHGKPSVVEFNARPPDPETQVMLPGVENYPELVLAATCRRLNEITPKIDQKFRWCVVGASRGYPNNYSQAKGKRIYGLDEAAELDGVKIYSAGIEVRDGKHYASGGRLFSVVGEGNNPLEARQRSYEGMSYISIEGNNLHFRTDIGWRDIERFLKKPA